MRVASATAMGLAVLVVALPSAALAEPPPEPAAPVSQPATGGERPAEESDPAARRKSYLVPAAEVVAINLALNAAGRWLLQEDYAEVTWETIEDNIDPESWTWEAESFGLNQLGHAYQGTTYYTAARSSGLDGWTSFGYAVGGSLLWELFGETDPPSFNDQITTPVAGMLLGEALYRLHVQAITRIDRGFWRESASIITAPMAGLNRLLFGDRFGPREEDRRSSAYGELQLGAAGLGQNSEWRAAGHAGGRFIVGLPGDAGLRLRGPLGHLDVRATLTLEADADATGFVRSRGALWGRTFATGSGGGLWGLFGQYDYVAPGPFRVSVIGLGAGASVAWRVGSSTLGGTVLVCGVPYGAGSVNPRTDETLDEHFGQGGAGTVEGQAVWADRLRLELAAREYVIVGTIDSSGHENLSFASATLSYRLFGPHGLGLGGQWSHRRSRIDGAATSQHEESIMFTYQLLARGMGGPD